ncbi:MAG: hypothetical protein ACREV8_02725 [Gammaproteobacteria bacterium]
MELVTAADYSRFVDIGRQTLERLREVAPTAEATDSQREALRAFAAQRTVEHRFLTEMTDREIAEVALEFRLPAIAAAARIRRTFRAVGAPKCADYPYLR